MNVWWLLSALAAGPAAWILQLLIGYGVASHLCFPRERPHLNGLPGKWASEPAWLLAVNLVCLCLALGATLASYRSWRGARLEKRGGAESVFSMQAKAAHGS